MTKNVLIFSHGYKNGFIEASNQYCRLFDSPDYIVTVVYLDGVSNDEIRKKHYAENVFFLNTPREQKNGLKLAPIKKMFALHRRYNFQIVICHRYKPSYIMLLVAKFCKIPALFCVMHEMKTFKHFSRKLIFKLLAPKNLYLTGVSNAVSQDLKKSLGSSFLHRIITLYNVIDIASTEMHLLERTTARNRLSLSENDFVFGILSRLVPAKDHKTLIDAFSIIKPLCPHAKLIIIGEGELELSLKKHVSSLNLDNDITMTGFLKEGANLLKSFDVFVLSSVKEAFGRVLLEAMIAKCPIIATKTDGILEVLDKSGKLVEKQNVHELANAMHEFYHMSACERSSYGDKGYQRAKDVFSIQRFKEEFWQLPNLSSSRCL